MKKSKMKLQFLALIMVLANVYGLNAQTWDFTSGIENWSWGQERCTITQSSGSLVIASDGTGSANFGINSLNLPATNLNSMVFSLKNQSNAPYFAVNLWVLIPNGSGGYAEEIRSFLFNVTPNTPNFQPYLLNLSTAIVDFSHTWKINRIRIDAVGQTNTSVLTFDYIKLTADTEIPVTPEVLSFSTPSSKMSSYRPGSDASFVVSVGNNSNQVNKVEFYRDDVKIGEDLTAPYEHTISNVQSGYYKITAVAFNNGTPTSNTALSELFVGTSKVGVRPLARGAKYDFDREAHPNVPGGYFEDYKGQYPFVASYTDAVTVNDYGINFIGDFRSRETFFEHYLPFDSQWIDTNPQTNPLIKTIRQSEQYGVSVKHIIISREGKLYGKPSYTWGSHPIEWRLLFQKDIDDYRKLFKDAFDLGLIKYSNYKLIQLLSEPSVFATDSEVQKIIKNMDGVAYELHQYNVFWPLESGKNKDLTGMANAVKWTLANNLDYILYYGPWRSTTEAQYYEDCPKDWLQKLWNVGMPKYHDNMHIYTNDFPLGGGTNETTPVGPETNPDSHTGFVKWLIEETGRKTPLPVVERIAEKVWNFNKSIETWYSDLSNSDVSWLDGSLIVSAKGDGSVTFGVKDFNYNMDGVDTLFVRLKNSTPATQLTVTIWCAEPNKQAEFTKTFAIPISSNSATYKNYIVDLKAAIAGFSNDWRVRRISVNAAGQSASSMLYIDFIRFVDNAIFDPITGISIDTPATITVNLLNDYKYLSCTVFPANASTDVVWSVINGTGSANIDKTGKLIPVSKGTVKVVVTSITNPAVSASIDITITDIYVPVSAIEITTVDGFDVYVGNDMQFGFTFKPYNASNPNVNWEVLQGTGTASISNTGLLKTQTVGTVIVKAAASDDAAVFAEKTITIKALPPQTPYLVTNAKIPGVIEAENYDFGGQYVSFFDDNVKNGSVTIRPDDKVDMEVNGKDTYVGWIDSGEWLEYSVDIVAGNYNIDVMAASAVASPGDIKISINGQDVGIIDIKGTGDWVAFNKFSALGIGLSTATNAVLRLTAVGGAFNIDKITFIDNSIVLVNSISIEGPTTIDGIGQKVQLLPKISPENATNKKLKFSGSNSQVATIDENTGLLTTVSAGVVRIVIQAQDASQVFARLVFTVTNSTSVNSYNTGNLKIFPNPAKNNMTICSADNQVNEVKIVDLQGRIVYWNKEQFSGQKSINIDLEKGIYFVKLTGNVQFEAMKLIIE